MNCSHFIMIFISIIPPIKVIIRMSQRRQTRYSSQLVHKGIISFKKALLNFLLFIQYPHIFISRIPKQVLNIPKNLLKHKQFRFIIKRLQYLLLFLTHFIKYLLRRYIFSILPFLVLFKILP